MLVSEQKDGDRSVIAIEILPRQQFTEGKSETEIFDYFKNLVDEVIAIIKPKLDLSQITEQSNLVTDLGIDSLSMLMLSLGIENKFGFQFSNQKPFQTVGEVIDYIELLLAK